MGVTADKRDAIQATNLKTLQGAVSFDDNGDIKELVLATGLEGNGGIAARRQITTKELADYVIKRVEELAKAQKAEQEPQYFKGRDAEDYVLARW
jgi:hypothetical protein